MFLSCGDSLYDLFVQGTSEHQGSAHSSAVYLGGNVGGSPLNVALGLARLGHHSRYLTKLSSDVFGQRMKRFLQDNEIDASLSIESDLNTTLAIVEKKADGSPDYVFYTENTADVSMTVAELPEQLAVNIKALHFGSYSTVVNPTGASLAHLAARESQSRLISYDPNIRPSIEADVDRWREVFQTFASSASVIKASDEDIETLLGRHREDQFVSDCFNAGAELVFVTRGAYGASGYTPVGNRYDAPGVEVKVRDTVGAGDTFQATILHWLAVHNHIDTGQLVGDVDVPSAMAMAIRASAVTCTRPGADLPNLHDIT